MVAQVLDEVTLQEPRCLVRNPLPAEARVHRKPLEVGDPGAPVRGLEAHHARTLAVDLDHEAPICGRIGSRTLELRLERLTIATGSTAEEGLDVCMVDEVEQEAEVVGTGPSDRDHRLRT